MANKKFSDFDSVDSIEEIDYLVGYKNLDNLKISTELIKNSVGQDGADGVDGKSAYEIALENGFVGTEQEWLDSLKGADGQDGLTTSVNGIQQVGGNITLVASDVGALSQLNIKAGNNVSVDISGEDVIINSIDSEDSNTTDHALLSNLDYTQSGHTGFVSIDDLTLKADTTTLTAHENNLIKHTTQTDKELIATITDKLEAINIKAGENVSVDVIGNDVTIGVIENQDAIIDHDLLTNRNASDQHPISAITGLTDALIDKVDVVPDKGLSENDFTDEIKEQYDRYAEEISALNVQTDNNTIDIEDIRTEMINNIDERNFPWCSGYFQDKSFSSATPTILTPIVTTTGEAVGSNSMVNGTSFIAPEDGLYLLQCSGGNVSVNPTMRLDAQLHVEGPHFVENSAYNTSFIPLVVGLVYLKASAKIEHRVCSYNTNQSTINNGGAQRHKFTFARIG